MANDNHLRLISEGVQVLNKWRKDNPDYDIDLSGADLRGVNLSGAKLSEANLTGTNLRGANLSRANLRMAKLIGANLSGACLNKAMIGEANLTGAILHDTQLIDADLYKAILHDAKLINAILYKADLYKTEFIDAKLIGANLRASYCYRTDFSHANLTEANLHNASLIETNLEQAILIGCKIYGLSAWGLKGTPRDQSKLLITTVNEAEITVDDLQLAQFIYLLLNNENVRNVIDTITSKAVLILGRFTPERKKVLDLLRQELHKYDYVPILFDFENTQNQSLLETVMTLAGMARFIIADVTDATMVREEVRSIVEKYPSKPIQPILLNTEGEYVTFPEIMIGFKSLLKVYKYKDQGEVVSELKPSIIDPAEAWIEARKSQILGDFKTEREMELEREIEALKNKLNEMGKQ